MESLKAELIERNGNAYLVLNLSDENLEIPITEDKPKDIQLVFNKLIQRLKNGAFNFKFEENVKKDINYFVCEEYIKQLNSEIKDVFSEMEKSNLLSSKGG